MIHFIHVRLDMWEKYIDCMLSGMTIRESALECIINKKTAFIWRHKILDALQSMMDDVKLDGIVEADETFFPVSYKGNHKKSTTFIMPRPSHHRGKSSHMRGLSSDKVCVPCAVNRDGLSIAKISNLARLKRKGLEAIYTGKISPKTVFITDEESAASAGIKPHQLLFCDCAFNNRVFRILFSLSKYRILYS